MTNTESHSEMTGLSFFWSQILNLMVYILTSCVALVTGLNLSGHKY